MTILVLSRSSLGLGLPNTVAREILNTRVDTTDTDLVRLIGAWIRFESKAAASRIVRLWVFGRGDDDERGAKAVEAWSWWELEGAYDVGRGVRDACGVDGCTCFIEIWDTGVTGAALGF